MSTTKKEEATNQQQEKTSNNYQRIKSSRERDSKSLVLIFIVAHPNGKKTTQLGPHNMEKHETYSRQDWTPSTGYVLVSA
jgi:hypothetical protein